MRILKKVLLGIVLLIALLLLIAAFLPKDYLTEREIVINKPEAEVFEYIKFVKNQDNYGVWQLSDPNMKKTYEGTDGTVGFKYTWDSEEMGKGSQEIAKIIEDERFETILNFGFGEPANCHILTEPVSENQTKVTWGISGRNPWPFNLMGMLYDVGKDFEQGLQNLKNQLEK